MGSLVGASSGLTFKTFTKSNCQGGSEGNDLTYGQNEMILKQGVVRKFKSFRLSRPLQDQEQLDLSHTGQDSGQIQVYSCGEFITNYQVGTKGCQNIPNKETAECVRLWHY